MISFSLMTLILVPMLGLVLSSRGVAAESRHYTLARTTAESHVERLKALANTDALAFANLATTINASPTFVVPGLPGRADGQPHGRITTVLDENDLDGVADANDVEMSLGGIDLDGNGSSTNALTATSAYRVLPVRVEVSWGREPEAKVVIDVVIAPRFGFRRST